MEEYYVDEQSYLEFLEEFPDCQIFFWDENDNLLIPSKTNPSFLYDGRPMFEAINKSELASISYRTEHPL